MEEPARQLRTVGPYKCHRQPPNEETSSRPACLCPLPTVLPVIELAEHGRAIRPATIQVALGELVSAELVASTGEDGQQRWRVLPTARDPMLEAVDLHGAHDFRHTFATWLEDAGIPARVIDEVMGHEATSRVGQQRGSAMGAQYRHTTPEMAARITAAIEQRLTVVLKVAEQALEAQPSRSTQRVF
jgi:predicted ArsR family transcriptional regulator